MKIESPEFVGQQNLDLSMAMDVQADFQATEIETESDPASDTEMMLGFRVGSLGFLVAAGLYCEVAERLQVSPLPGVEPWFSGLLNLRGNIVPVIDLQVLNGEKIFDSKKRRLFAVGQGDKTMAFWIDKLPETLSINTQSPVSLPALAPLLQHYVSGAYGDKGQVWLAVRFEDLFKTLGGQEWHAERRSGPMIQTFQQVVDRFVTPKTEAAPSPQQNKQTIEDYIDSIGQFADQAALDGHYGLQDACLVIVETLRELPPEPAVLTTSLLSMLDEWPLLMVAYRQQPIVAIEGILKILRHPDLKLPLTEDEFIMIEAMLAEGANINVGPLPQPTAAPDNLLAIADTASEQQTVSSHIDTIEALANQAELDHYYALQDACLLLAEALGNLPQNVSPTASSSLLALLADWPTRVSAYYKAPAAATGAIIKTLRHPDLHLALTEDEFDLLETALANEAGSEANDDAKSAPLHPPFSEDEFALLEAALTAEDESLEDAAQQAPLSAAMLELIQLLMAQGGLIDNHLLDIAVSDPLSVDDGLQQLTEDLERYANASAMAGFEGLALLCAHVNANVQIMRESTFTAGKQALLQAWVGHVKDYLADFNAADAGQKLLAHMGDDWPLPLTPEAGTAILTQIRAAGLAIAAQQDEIRQQVASDEDVSLALPDDVNEQLLEILLQELPTHTQQFSEAVQRMQAGGGLQDIEIAQRAAHTLKGSANTVGIKGIAVLTHQLEDILTACAHAQRLPGAALAYTLIEAADCLESMSEHLMGLCPPPENAQVLLQGILDWANRIDQQGLEEIDSQTPTMPESSQVTGDGLESADSAASAQSQTAQASQTQTTMVRVPSEQIDNLFRLTGESIILNSQTYERLRRMKSQLQTMEAQFALLQRLGDELQELIDLKDLSGRMLASQGLGFDALEMDQYNELHTASRRLVEAAVDAREIGSDVRKELDQANELLDYQQRMIIDTQEAVMKTRLVPVDTITPRLQRGLRQTCRLTGKQSDLSISGENLLIDGDTLNLLIDPLMHLLRNAVDHGIENKDERLALGKPERGQIAVKFDREGNDILVKCSDDGRGLDFASIRRAAEKRGLLTPDQDISEDELKRLILRPNFSTRSQSTQTSGRGVGMDVVYHQVVDRGGRLSLHSEPGCGMTVDLRMPLPLSRSHALLAQAGPYRVAIAGKGVTQILYPDAGSLKILDDVPVLELGDDIYPAIALNQLLRIPQATQQPDVVLLVQSNDQTTAVLLDGLTGSLDIVIKTFGHYIKKIPGFVGAAIMADGLVAPVLDIPELLRFSNSVSGYYPIQAEESFVPSLMLPTALVVDDSLSQRRALEQLLDDIGFRVISARDGIEAIELLETVKPSIVLTDLEMPRMNGIELASHIRSKEGFKSLPIIMITSRTTQKHRKMATDVGIDLYLVKPVREDDLLAKMQILMEEAVL